MVKRSIGSFLFVLAFSAIGDACGPIVGRTLGNPGWMIYIVALGIGYGVLTLSQRQERPLNVLGRIIGAVILLVALVGLVVVGIRP